MYVSCIVSKLDSRYALKTKIKTEYKKTKPKTESPKSVGLQTIVTGAESTDINLFKFIQSITMHRLRIYKPLLTHDQFTWILRRALPR